MVLLSTLLMVVGRKQSSKQTKLVISRASCDDCVSDH